MESFAVIAVACACIVCLTAAYLFWRCYWFFRNPPRKIPPGDGILSAADGTVVYVQILGAGARVISIKEGVSATIEDIVREDLCLPKLLIGTFMSPFDVHYNRSPLQGKVDSVRHHPAKSRNLHMTAMHLRTVLNRAPLYWNSLHIKENERTVTRIVGTFRGRPTPCYVVQIGGGSVNGIESFRPTGADVARGEIFGMIRIGSQVDIVLPYRADMRIRIRPGVRVRAGESVLVD